MRNDKSINVRISEELYNTIAADAKAQNISLNEVVRRTLQAKWNNLEQNSYDPYPFDEFDFLLIGPQDIFRQIINNDFSRNTIKWNESVFNGKHEDQYNYKRLIDTPKNLDNEISILGQQDWNRWKAAISCMPASNDIIPLPLPQNPRHQWMYVFLAAGPHISSREAFCGLIKQAYKETRDEIWKNPGNTIATLEPFTYAAAMRNK